MAQPVRDKVFVSYCRKDKRWLKQLQTTLAPLVRKGELSLWSDAQIKAGDRWRQEIEAALASAKLAILLVSPDFLASDFVAQKELPPLLKAAETDGVKIIWIHVSSCPYYDTPIGAYQAAHDVKRPLDLLRPAHRNIVFTQIYDQIKSLLEKPERLPESTSYTHSQASRQSKGSKSIKDPRPADLEIRVKLAGGALHYTLHSANGVAGYTFKEIPGAAIVGSPEAFRASLMERIEQLHKGRGADGEALLLREVSEELEDLGRWLYAELFPPEMRAAYRRFRHEVRSLQITSEEPWIPWEMVKPFDASDPEAIIDDDFLCVEFELTRWLAGDTNPEPLIRVNRLAVLEVGAKKDKSKLRQAAAEKRRVAGLAGNRPEVEDASPRVSGFTELKSLLRAGGLGLLHFVGHGDYAANQPDDSQLELADRVFRPINLSDPKLQAQVRNDRPLVFLNACRTGRQGWSLTGLGGWAEAWVRDCGCGAFVAPQWRVSDKLAYAFADAYYAALEEGKTFGEATREARAKLRAQAPGGQSWLAYRVYSHPNGHLVLGVPE